MLSVPRAHDGGGTQTLQTRDADDCSIGPSLRRSLSRRQNRRFPAGQFPSRAVVAQTCFCIPMVYVRSRRVVAGSARRSRRSKSRPRAERVTCLPTFIVSFKYSVKCKVTLGRACGSSLLYLEITPRECHVPKP